MKIQVYSILVVVMKRLIAICLTISIAITSNTVVAQVMTSVVSSADGWESALDLATNLRSQHDLKIQSDDLELIKKLIENVKSRQEFREYFASSAFGKEDFEIAKDKQLLVRLSMDKYVRAELENILDPNQRLLRRQTVLRKKFFFPSSVFEQTLLKEIGLDDVEGVKLLEIVENSIRQLFNSMEQLRKEEINLLLAHLPLETKAGFVSIFGENFLVGIKGRSNVTKRELQICQEDNATQQLRNTSLLMPDVLGLSGTQFSELLKLKRKEAVRHAQNVSEDRSHLIDEELDQILTPQQRVAVLQAMHQELLKVNLQNLLRTEIGTFAGLSKGELVELRERWVEPAKTIEKTRKEGEKKIYDAGVQALPKIPRQRFEQLMEGVWNDWFD